MSAPPPGYNASESLLSGGTEQIVPVMGGGKRKTKKKGKKQQGGTNPFILREAPWNETQPNNPINQTTFKLTLKDAAIQIKTSLDKAVLAKYVKRQEALWVRRGSGAGATQYITMSSVGASKMKYDVKNGNKGQSGFDRHGIILPKTVDMIVVVPPIHGNMSVYDLYMKRIKKMKIVGTNENIIDTDTVVILFAPPFYGACDDTHIPDITQSYTDNAAIFRDFIVQKSKAKCKMYVVTEYTQNSIASGASVTNAVGGAGTHIVTLLEPSYVMYPYHCSISQNTYSGLIFSGAAEAEVAVPDSNITNKFGILSSAQNGFTSVAYPPNIKTMDPGIANAKIPYSVYTFNDLKKINTSENTFNIFSIKGAMIQENTEALAASDDFMVSDRVFLTSVTYSPISLGGIQYSIRYPDTDVVEDWKELKFTQDEADFLIALRIKPMFLNKIYGDKPWNDELATNLATIVRSNCFKDSRLVLHSQCQQSQKFIAKILKYLVENDKTILELEAGDEMAKAKRAPAAAAPPPIVKGKSPFGGPEGLILAPNYDPGHDQMDNINGDVFKQFIKVLKRSDQTFQYGKISIKNLDLNNPGPMVKKKLDELTKNYPEYLFVIED